jgi:uncharacterized membrane protein
MQIEAFRKCQAVTGLYFSAFLLLHLFNHFLAILGEDQYNNFLQFSRKIYQNPYVELSLLFTVSVHVFCAITLWIKRKKRKIEEPFLTTAFRWCGWFLMIIVPVHFYFGRIMPFQKSVDVNFAFSAFGLTNLTQIYFPYYFFFSSFAIIHMIVGITKSLEITKLKTISQKLHWVHYLIVFLLIVLISLVLMSYSNFFYAVDKYNQFSFWKEYYEKLY